MTDGWTTTLAAVTAACVEELGTEPTLGEFLEILALSVPSNDPAAEELPSPLLLTAKVDGGRIYRDATPSRVGRLNDAAFVEAAEALGTIAERIAASTGQLATADEVAEAVRQELGSLSFADVSGDRVRSLTVATAKRVRPKVADIVAIPVRPATYRLAVVVANNTFGTALGLFDGEYRTLRPSTIEPKYRPRPVYTDDDLFANGTWIVVGHDESLLSPFPAEPERFHWPDPTWRGIGPHGSAETPGGKLRNLTEEEAREVGLLDNRYQQIYASEYLTRLLAEGTL